MSALEGKVQFLQKAVVWNPDGRTFLALRRSLDDATRPGRWDLPGGNVTYGEDHREAIRREIREETGLDITDLRPVQVVTQMYRGGEVYLIFVGHRCQALLRSVQPWGRRTQDEGDDALSDDVTLSEEHIDYRWVTGEEFMALEELAMLVDLVAEVTELG
jgi:8-oxo-dGTP pyrophosphatase MutT (NUDIX family)